MVSAPGSCAIASPSQKYLGRISHWMANRKVLLPMDHFPNICPHIISGVITTGHQMPGPVNG